MNWLDLGLIIFIIAFLVLGYRRGFLNSVLSNFSVGLKLVVTFFLYKPISGLLNAILNIKGSIAFSYSTKLLESSPNFSVNLLSLPKETLNTFVGTTLSKSQLPKIQKFMFNIFLNNQSLYDNLHSTNTTTRTLADIVSETYGSFYLTIVSFVVTFLLVCLVVWLFKLLTNHLRKIGFIKVVDDILGIVYGLGRCFFIFVIICFALKLLSPIPFIQPITNYISQSLLGGLIYNQINNLLDNYLNYQEIIRFFTK